MKVIPLFQKKETEHTTKARIENGKLHAPEGYHANDDSDRMERLRRSLEKINKLMKELKND